MIKMLKQMYSALALFALIHVLTLVGLGGFAWATGRIDQKKVERIAAIVRGEDEQEKEQVKGADVIGGPKDSAKTSESKIREAIEAGDIVRLKIEKAIVDLKQQQNLQDRRMLALQMDREAFEKRKALEEDQRRKREEQEIGSYWERLIQAIGGMNAKNARDHLMQTPDSDAVKILLTLDERETQRILDSCKTIEQKTWRDRMLNLMRKQPPDSKGGLKP